MAQKVAPTTWQPLHYGKVAEDSASGRRNSRIAGLRLFNNEVKRRLIRDAATTTETHLRVADLCCGRGGDIQKFVDVSDGRLVYVGADVTPEQISCARERTPETSSIKWMVADCFSENTAAPVLDHLGQKADIVSCQFALHYAFRDSRTLSNFLNLVASVCKPGGSFIFTTTDSDTLIEYAIQEQHSDALCSVTLEEPMQDGPFGAGVFFKLDARVCDREWLVHRRTLHAELTRRGFAKVQLANLQHYASKKKCALSVPTMSYEERSIARLYIVGHYKLSAAA